nr:MAG TPA: hypothetical protein [Caudoviricetes sp.]
MTFFHYYFIISTDSGYIVYCFIANLYVVIFYTKGIVSCGEFFAYFFRENQWAYIIRYVLKTCRIYITLIFIVKLKCYNVFCVSGKRFPIAFQVEFPINYKCVIGKPIPYSVFISRALRCALNYYAFAHFFTLCFILSYIWGFVNTHF